MPSNVCVAIRSFSYCRHVTFQQTSAELFKWPHLLRRSLCRVQATNMEADITCNAGLLLSNAGSEQLSRKAKLCLPCLAIRIRVIENSTCNISDPIGFPNVILFFFSLFTNIPVWQMALPLKLVQSQFFLPFTAKSSQGGICWILVYNAARPWPCYIKMPWDDWILIQYDMKKFNWSQFNLPNGCGYCVLTSIQFYNSNTKGCGVWNLFLAFLNSFKQLQTEWPGVYMSADVGLTWQIIYSCVVCQEKFRGRFDFTERKKILLRFGHVLTT